jgi:hypothetical protein
LLNESRKKWKSIASNNCVKQLSFSLFDFKSMLQCFFGLGAGRRVYYGLTLFWHVVDCLYGYLVMILSSLGSSLLLSNGWIRLTLLLKIRGKNTDHSFMSGKWDLFLARADKAEWMGQPWVASPLVGKFSNPNLPYGLDLLSDSLVPMHFFFFWSWWLGLAFMFSLFFFYLPQQLRLFSNWFSEFVI